MALTLVWVPAVHAQLAPAPFPGFNPNAGIDRTAPPVLASVTPNVASGQQRIFLNGFNFSAFNTVVFSGPTVATAGASSAVGNSAVTFLPAHLPPGVYTVTLVDAYGRPSNPTQLQVGQSFTPSSLFSFPGFGFQPQQPTPQRAAFSRSFQNPFTSPQVSQNPLSPYPVPNSGGFPSNAGYPPWVYGASSGLPSNAAYPPWVYGISR